MLGYPLEQHIWLNSLAVFIFEGCIDFKTNTYLSEI
jgi:hypothetical protein